MSRRILFVDDEVNLLQATERRFRKEFTIQTAAGPEAALSAMKESGPFAVVVSDLRMPLMNGVDFLIRASNCRPTRCE